MADVGWSEEALEQLNLIVAYIELFDQVAARRVEQRLADLGDSLADFPNRGRPRPDGTREMVTVPPYILRYLVEDDHVFVVGVRHGRRQD